MLIVYITKDDCRIGPASDEHRLVDAMSELRDAWKQVNGNYDIAMEMSAKSTNLYMGIEFKSAK
jgi:hypothetical protein